MDAKDIYPEYHFPKHLLRGTAVSFIKGSPRNILQDARIAITGITPPVHIVGTSNIPRKGPLLITMNHYARQGFSIAWAVLAIAAQLPENQKWLMTSAWTNRTLGFDQLRTAATRLVFHRLAKMYGMITTPPLPAAQNEQKDRAISIRRVFRLLKSDPQAVLCIAPEGRDFHEGELGKPTEGTGKFVMQLEKQLNYIVPVGVWEGYGRLILNFGTPYSLHKHKFGKNGDEEVSYLVMNKIASLLPSSIRRNFEMEEFDEKR